MLEFQIRAVQESDRGRTEGTLTQGHKRAKLKPVEPSTNVELSQEQLVQARIRNVVRGAIYTHCKAHNLNLSIIHASKEPLVRNVMNTLQEIVFVYNYSAKKLSMFKEQLANDAVARAN